MVLVFVLIPYLNVRYKQIKYFLKVHKVLEGGTQEEQSPALHMSCFPHSGRTDGLLEQEQLFGEISNWKTTLEKFKKSFKA